MKEATTSAEAHEALDEAIEANNKAILKNSHATIDFLNLQ